MAGGMLATVRGDEFKQYEGAMTCYVVLSAICAGMGGLLFGYDVGITGGVTSMQNFLERFFPRVAAQSADHAANASSDAYCTYTDVNLQLFTSSLFLAAAFAGLAGSYSTRRYGRRATMLLGGICFLIGAALTSASYHLPQLVIGRVVLGCGVGLATQSVPLYLSEIAPVHLRGCLNIMFQLSITIGILVAELINLGTQYMAGESGWRTSLALAAVPALILTFGAIILPETPNSLCERGKLEEARRILERIRGTNRVDAEFDDIKAAAVKAEEIKHPWRDIFKKDYRPEFTIAFGMPFLQQLTGINSIMFYAPIIFKTINANGALLSTVITGAINVAATFISVFSVDKAGRKVLLLTGGVQMIAAEIIMAVLLGVYFTGQSGDKVPYDVGIGILVVVCVFVSGFAYSWGPLAWLVPSEVLSLEVRSAGYSMVTFLNFIMTFVVGQSFLSMLCAFRYGIFLFFAGWVIVMTLFVMMVVPETKNIPLEEMHFIWEKHWAWRRWAQDKQRRIEMAKPGTEDFVVSQAHPMAADGAKPV